MSARIGVMFVTYIMVKLIGTTISKLISPAKLPISVWAFMRFAAIAMPRRKITANAKV